MPISLVAVQCEIAERDVSTPGWCWWTRIGRQRCTCRAVMDAIIVGTRLKEESCPAPQPRDTPTAPRRQKEPRYKGTSVNDQCDGIVCCSGSHRFIDPGSVVSRNATGVLVAPGSQIAIQGAADLRSADVCHASNRRWWWRRAQTGDGES